MPARLRRVATSHNPYEVIGSGLADDVLVRRPAGDAGRSCRTHALFGSAGEGVDAAWIIEDRHPGPRRHRRRRRCSTNGWSSEATASRPARRSSPSRPTRPRRHRGVSRRVHSALLVARGATVPIGDAIAVIADSIDEPVGPIAVSPSPGTPGEGRGEAAGDTNVPRSQDHAARKPLTRNPSPAVPARGEHATANFLARRLVPKNGADPPLRGPPLSACSSRAWSPARCTSARARKRSRSASARRCEPTTSSSAPTARSAT